MHITEDLASKLITNFETDMLIFEDVLAFLHRERAEEKGNIQSVSEMIGYKKILLAELQIAFLAL